MLATEGGVAALQLQSDQSVQVTVCRIFKALLQSGQGLGELPEFRERDRQQRVHVRQAGFQLQGRAEGGYRIPESGAEVFDQTELRVDFRGFRTEFGEPAITVRRNVQPLLAKGGLRFSIDGFELAARSRLTKEVAGKCPARDKCRTHGQPRAPKAKALH